MIKNKTLTKQKEFLETLKDPITAFIRKQIAKFKDITMVISDICIIKITEPDPNIHKIEVTLPTKDLFKISEVVLYKLFPPSSDYRLHSTFNTPNKIYSALDGDTVYTKSYFIVKTSVFYC